MVPMKVLGRIISIIVCCASVVSESETYDWFGAQELCRNSSKRLITDASDSLNFIWTGKHKRLSQWIKILGCYKESNIPGNLAFNMTDYPSIGLCQEQCSRLHNSVYAVKASECRCLQIDFKAIPLPLNECNIACSNKEDDILSTECGGEKAFSVFSTETDSAFLNDGQLCIALQCNEVDARFYQHDCTDELGVICGFSEIRDKKMRWKESFLSCKSNISTSQMVKFDLTNAEEACKIVNITSDVPLWIGIVREKYLSEDQGDSILDRSVFIKCQKCKASHCEYVTCFNQNVTEVNCTAVSIPAISQTGLEGVDIKLIIGVPIAVFLSAITVVVIVLVICRRKKLKYKQKEPTLTAIDSVLVQKRKFSNKYKRFTKEDIRHLGRSNPSYVRNEENEKEQEKSKSTKRGENNEEPCQTTSRKIQRSDIFHYSLHNAHTYEVPYYIENKEEKVQVGFSMQDQEHELTKGFTDN